MLVLTLLAAALVAAAVVFPGFRRWCGEMAVVASVCMVALVALALPAAAQGADVVAPTANHVVTMPQLWLAALSGVIIPIVHAAITKLNGSNIVRVGVGLILSIVAAVIGTATVLDGVAVFSETTAAQAILTAVAQWAVSRNLYKPLGVPSSPALAPDRGLG